MQPFQPPFKAKYSERNFGPPRDSENAKEKLQDKDWFVRKAEWLYSLWLTGYNYIPYTQGAEWQNLRLYAQGRQPTVKYMDILDPRNPETQMRSGFYNMSWDIVPIFPKYRDRIRGALSRFDYVTNVQALDDNSQMDRLFLKMRAYVMEKEKQWMQEVMALAGGDINEVMPDQNLPMQPRSLQEADMIEAMGGFRLPLEASFEKLLYKSARLSEWEEIKNKMEEDAIDCGVMACQDYTDPVSGIPMTRYVDPAYLIVGNMRDNAYTEIDEAGEIRFFTLAQLKDYGLSDDEIQVAATSYSGMFNNPQWNNIYNNGAWDYRGMGMYRVAVLDIDFSSWNMDYYEGRRLANGNDRFFQISKQNYGKDKKKTYRKKQYERRYQCKWVIGTNLLLPGFGYQYNQVFSSDNRPKCSYSIYRVAERSITSRCVSTLDDIQLAVLKFRNAWAKAKPAGILVEWGSLSGMTMGGKKMDPLDILRIYRTTGDLIHKISTDGNGRILQGVSKPVDELQGGIGNMLNEFVQTLQTHLQTLANITAVGVGQDGTLPPADTLVGVASMAEAATQDTFRPILLGYKRVKSRTMNNLCLRWQLELAKRDISEIVTTEGTAGEMVRLSFNDVTGRIIQVDCDMVIDDTQKQMAIQAAMESLKAAKTGSVGITYADFLVVMQALQRGQVKYAFMWIHYREEQEKMRQQQLQEENMRLNQEGAKENEILKGEIAAQQLQAKMALAQLEGSNSIAEIKEKGNQDRETLRLKYSLETGRIQPAAQPEPTLSQNPLPPSPMPQTAMPEGPMQEAAIQQSPMQQPQDMQGMMPDITALS